MASFNSWDALKKAIEKEAYAALEEAMDKSYEDAHDDVDNFYNSPEGRYKRTGQLGESVQHEITGGGDSLNGRLWLDTSYQYNPAGRDTQTIYGYAENGGLLGNGGFWKKTEEDTERNVQEAFSKHFG